ncbi:nucleoprotein [Lyssavirus caucasicus]|uniref:Nucleoprotein n=1 Tax=West Caucasian bat virus TaxID=249584 RepID=NCAP_WCBV|nr:nucleoprotein [Lyssavirus caucasicus]Q5VKP2.1 RecName: Full=Nucleoprotein; Short=NP; AltName: Full=Nucleocapsid protein; Short=Protein N [Lyssavirus caucasicus]AAR03481.1 nucleoprotein [Lyssavirus caucasicus]UGD08555.1 nucleoprotein [Lyssavirus caucasicus]
MDSEHIVFRVRNEIVTLKPEVISDQYEYKYPAITDKKKPSITLGRAPDLSIAYRSILSGFNAAKLDPDDVCSYLAAAMPLFEGVCPEDWISYGIIIARKGDKINPSHLVDIMRTEVEGNWSQSGGADVTRNPTVAEHASLVGLLLCLYRLSKIVGQNTANYKTNVADRMEQIFETAPFVKIIEHHTLMTTHKMCANWSTIPNFRFLVGTYDMFFSRIDHLYSALRVGTVVTAYEDCTGLVSFTAFLKQINLSARDAILYFFHKNFEEEIRRMFRPNQETAVPHSYFIHFRSLGLSGKSPYSSNAVGHVFNLIHFVGCYMGQVRSLNATVIQTCAPHEMSVLGGYLGEEFFGKGTFERRFFRDERELQDHLEAEEAKIDIALADDATVDSGDEDFYGGESRSPEAVYNRIIMNKGRLKKLHIKRYRSVSSNHQARPNTFAEFLNKVYSDDN